MLVLALDTTTRAGSLSLARDGATLETFVGDAERTHATRLPGDILDCLARHDLCAGRRGPLRSWPPVPGRSPGSASASRPSRGWPSPTGGPSSASRRSTRWRKRPARRRRQRRARSGRPGWTRSAARCSHASTARAARDGPKSPPPVVRQPAAVLADWADVAAGHPVEFAGDGALAYADAIEAALGPSASIVRPVPLLAPAIARLAGTVCRRRSRRPSSCHPAGLHPAARCRTGARPTCRGGPLTCPSHGTCLPASPQACTTACPTAGPSTRWRRRTSTRCSPSRKLRSPTRGPGRCSCGNCRTPASHTATSCGRPSGGWRRSARSGSSSTRSTSTTSPSGPSAGGGGVGRALLEFVLRLGAGLGARRATLEVRRSNAAALKLYERLGFSVAGVRKNYYANPVEDALILWRESAGDRSGSAG